MKLPGELRNMIYRHALVLHGQAIQTSSRNIRRGSALLWVSRQVHRETKAIFYSLNYWALEGPSQSLAFLTKTSKPFIRHVTVCLIDQYYTKSQFVQLLDRLSEFPSLEIFAIRVAAQTLSTSMVSLLVKQAQLALDLQQRGGKIILTMAPWFVAKDTKSVRLRPDKYDHDLPWTTNAQTNGDQVFKVELTPEGIKNAKKAVVVKAAAKARSESMQLRRRNAKAGQTKAAATQATVKTMPDAEMTEDKEESAQTTKATKITAKGKSESRSLATAKGGQSEGTRRKRGHGKP